MRLIILCLILTGCTTVNTQDFPDRCTHIEKWTPEMYDVIEYPCHRSRFINNQVQPRQ